MQREGKRERKIRVAGREIQSQGRVSGMEGSLTGGLETGGCSAQELKIHPCAGSIAPAGAVLHPCVIFLVTHRSAWPTSSFWGTRSVASLIVSFLLVSTSAGLMRGVLWPRAGWAVMAEQLLFSGRLLSVSFTLSGVKLSQSWSC